MLLGGPAQPARRATGRREERALVIEAVINLRAISRALTRGACMSWSQARLAADCWTVKRSARTRQITTLELGWWLARQPLTIGSNGQKQLAILTQAVKRSAGRHCNASKGKERN